ncbi:YxeA family protein [Lactobacillus panisapium]|uniref:YxeA family protein n=2 Tax=Lactobacillaceae TaxID=33958 RepID=A0ABX8W5A2_9LACO|nr:YxeA family protein [Lactobacillus sp.]QYN52926.1 YxeA family protein [Lactobacillus panisapium]
MRRINMTSKKLKIIIVTAIVLLLCVPFVFHNSISDRFNPLITETISYAEVPQNTQKYYSVQSFNPKNGKLLPYKIKYVGGYSPNEKYIAIDHKGQYVRSIEYISKKEFLAAKKRAE